jgi:sugar/nucleoside kinase (ribokinase family)
MKLVAFGDNIVDRFVDRRIAYPGGNCVNVAVFAADAGADVAYVGVVGDDEAGDLVLEALRSHRVDTSRVVRRHGPTGVTNLMTRDGDRVFLDWNGGGVTVTHPYVIGATELDAFDDASTVHSSVYSAAEPELPKLRALGIAVSFDYSSEPEFRTDEYLASTAPFVDLALFSGGSASDAELTALGRRALAHGAGMVLITRGPAGAVLVLPDGEQEQTAIAVDPSSMVDTMGCGDAFLTGFVLAMVAAGWTPSSTPDATTRMLALRAGAECAARQCYVEGAFGMGRPFDDGASTAVAASIAEDS